MHSIGKTKAAIILAATIAIAVHGEAARGGAVPSRAVAVQPGDTLYGIARTALGDVRRWKEIAALNGLTPPYALEVGDTLALPIGGAPLIASGSADEADVPDAFTITETPAAIRDGAASPSMNHAVSFEQADPPPAKSAVLHEVAPDFVPAFTESLDSLLAALHLNNPAIRAAQESARAASYRPSQAGSLPDPMLRAALRFDVQNEVIVENGVTTVRAERMTMPMLQLSQMIPVGKLGPMSEMESKMAMAKSAMVGVETAMKVTALKTAYAELLLADRTSATLVQIREILHLLVASTEAMYRVGEARQSDLLRAHLEISMITDRLLMQEGRRNEIAAVINALLDRSDSVSIGTPEELISYRVDESALLDSSPAVRVAAAEVEAARARIAVARSMFIPDLEVMGGTMIQPDLDPRFEVGLGISLPIWSKTKQTPALREAEARLSEADERLRDARAAVRGRAAAALAMATAAEAQARLYDGTIIPQARFTLDASLSHYRVGEVDFMTVVENTTTVMKYEIARYETIAAFYRAVAMIEEATGASLAWKRADAMEE